MFKVNDLVLKDGYRTAYFLYSVSRDSTGAYFLLLFAN